MFYLQGKPDTGRNSTFASIRLFYLHSNGTAVSISLFYLHVMAYLDCIQSYM